MYFCANVTHFLTITTCEVLKERINIPTYLFERRTDEK